MSYPSAPFVLTRRQEKVPITGALIHTITPRLYWKGRHHSFGLGAVEMASATITNGFTGEVPTSNTFAAKHDQYNKIPPRHTAFLVDMMEFWDATTPGVAHTRNVTTTSGSKEITVGSGRLLTIGQGISGTGIPTGARIDDIVIDAESPLALVKVILTHAATGSGTVEATLTGANLVAQLPFADFGSFASSAQSTIT